MLNEFTAKSTVPKYILAEQAIAAGRYRPGDRALKIFSIAPLTLRQATARWEKNHDWRLMPDSRHCLPTKRMRPDGVRAVRPSPMAIS